MDRQRILADLRNERQRLDEAITALEALDGVRPRGVRGRPAGTATRRRRGGMSAAARKRMSEMMKARWAERRRKAKAA